jgi:hypothetical protein
MTAAAVITADIVNSTMLTKSESKKLMKSLVAILQDYQYEFYRGDSFQVYIKSPVEALWVLLQLRAAAMKTTPDRSMPVADIRACIGIGSVKPPVRSLKTATDEAFILSGRTFDAIKPDQRLLITCPEKNKGLIPGFMLAAIFIDYIFHRLTSKQSAVVFELLMKRTQTETARRLKKSQATINKHAQAAGWPEIEKLQEQYRILTNLIE